MAGDATTGLVFNVMRFSVHDGPGIRTTVFLKGCPLACWWCHNPESQKQSPELMFAADRCMRCGECVRACPQGALRWEAGPVRDADRCQACGTCVEACAAGARQIAGQRMSVAELMDIVRRDVVFFDESGGGVTFSGGEPLMQPAFLEAALKACWSEGIHSVVDTCGAASAEAMGRIIPLAGLFLYDLKLMDPLRHRHFTGAGNDLILRNLEALVQAGKAVMVRIPVIPGVNDDAENIERSIEFLSRIGVRRVDLLSYHATGVDKYRRLQMPYRLPAAAAPAPEYMLELSEKFCRKGFTVRLGG